MPFQATDAAHRVSVEIGLTKDVDELGPMIDFRNLRASPCINADKTVVITPRPDASREASLGAPNLFSPECLRLNDEWGT